MSARVQEYDGGGPVIAPDLPAGHPPFPDDLRHIERMWLETKGMTRRYLDAIGPCPACTPLYLLTSLARISPDDETGQFSFHPDGQPAVITPLFGECEGTDPMLMITCGTLHDLVAWHPAHGWVYTYGESATLGCSKIGSPIVAHRSVLEWFRSGCEGIVLLRA